jgi:hypothetical protein
MLTDFFLRQALQSKALLCFNYSIESTQTEEPTMKSQAIKWIGICALGGAAVGRASGDKALRSAGKGAAWGAATGGVAGNVASDGKAGVDSGYAVRRCIEGRGYEVLDYAREDRLVDNGDYGRSR